MKWMKKLSDKKKWKYIEMALDAKKKYDVSIGFLKMKQITK